MSPVKDVSGSSRSKHKKILSDKSGPQWSKGELQRFYEAYRIQAYLSLPDGTASMVGLIAMMTDLYDVMEGSDSERESNDASVVPQKSQKRKRAKVQLSASNKCFSVLVNGIKWWMPIIFEESTL